MIRTKIFIERKPLDLYDDVAAEFTYSIDDVKNFGSRNTNFSKTIVIPGTSANNKIFGHIFEFASTNPYNPSEENVGTNFNAAVAANCFILIDNVQIFKGVLRLMQINIDKGYVEYECSVFGELGGFSSALANKKLENLDFSAYNHNWTFENITNSWDTINGAGYYYPLIDYGKVSTNKHDWQYKALRPAYYVREIIDKIITGAGYTYDSTFLNSATAKRLIIPQNVKEMRQLSTTALRAPLEENVEYTPGGFTRLSFVPTTSGDFSYNTSQKVFTYNIGTPVTTDLTFYYFGEVTYPAPGSYVISINVFKNNALVGFQNIDLLSLPQSFNGTITINGLTFNQNDELYITAEINGMIPFTMIEGELSLISTDPKQLIAVNYGDPIDMNAFIPKGIFQRDFMTSIVKMFNLYVTEDNIKSKHLIIEAAANYYQTGEDVLLAVDDFGNLLEVEDNVNLIVEPGESAFLDWTDKLDRSKGITLKPMSELNGRYFEFKYKPDIDYYNEQYQKKYEQGYGDALIDTGYAFANDKQTAEVIFSATPLVGYNGEYKVYPTILKLTNVGTPEQIEDNTEHNIRILQAKKIMSVPSWQILDGLTIKGTTTSWGYAGNLDDPKDPSSDLNFGAPKELYFNFPSGITYPNANLYTSFWFDYVAEITNKDSKLLTCYMKLTEQDIFNLNFSRLVHIDGALWKLNKVIDFNSVDVTKCEFLRVLETSY